MNNGVIQKEITNNKEAKIGITRGNPGENRKV